MSAPPRLTLDLDAVTDATATLSGRLLDAGFTLVGVTKAVDGEPAVGQAMLEAGCAGLADSRLPALTTARRSRRSAPLTLIRPPQPRRARARRPGRRPRPALRPRRPRGALGERVAGAALEVLLTVDLGDRREGVLPEDVGGGRPSARHALPGIALAGVAVNFACLSGQLPSQTLFRQAEDVLAAVADDCADEPLLSLGGTCCLQHLDGYAPRFATEVRCGGGPLYGYDFVSGAPLEGLERRDPVLTAAVLECSRKPPAPPV